MNPLIKKLNFKDQEIVAILGAPESFTPTVDEWQELANIDTHLKRDTKYAFMLCFVTGKGDVQQFSEQIDGSLVDDAVLWLVYPKKSSKKYQTDINRDDGWQPLGDLGFEPVRMVAVDEDWSALRFRQAEHIKSLTRDSKMAMSEVGKKRTKK
ncbi:MAG: hypothetical protein KDD15_03470 [Lewinella sp.]|nr:hypothetical protein [Lewinella sp.]